MYFSNDGSQADTGSQALHVVDRRLPSCQTSPMRIPYTWGDMSIHELIRQLDMSDSECAGPFVR